MQCLVTGITHMNGNKVCLSLYQFERDRYIRPLKNGANFYETEIRGISLFSIVDINISDIQLNAEYPHIEDTNISPPYFTYIREATNAELHIFFSETSCDNAKEVFGIGSLIKQGNTWGVRKYLRGNVERLVGRYSLGVVEVRNFEIVQDGFNKAAFRVHFEDMVGNKFSFVKFVMKAEIEDFKMMVGKYTKSDGNDEFYLRLSLAREWNNGQWDFDMCTLQVSCFACFREGVLIDFSKQQQTNIFW